MSELDDKNLEYINMKLDNFGFEKLQVGWELKQLF